MQIISNVAIISKSLVMESLLNVHSIRPKTWFNNIADKDPMEMAESRFDMVEKSCNGDPCHEHEHCVHIEGVCVCNTGYARDSTGVCVQSTAAGETFILLPIKLYLTLLSVLQNV